MSANHIEKPSPSAARSSLSSDERMQQLQEFGLSAEGAAAALSIDDTMAFIRRKMMRREFLHLVIKDLDLDLEASQLMVVHVVQMHALNSDSAEMTVGLVSDRLGIDPSRASRLTADVVEKGLVRRVASQADARRICLELTDKGRAYQSAIFEYKARLYADFLSDWDTNELAMFAQLFERFGSWLSNSGKAPAGREQWLAAMAARVRDF